MKHWRVLGIGVDLLVFRGIKNAMLSVSPGCLMDLAATSEDGRELLLMYTYDLIIADLQSSAAQDLAELIAGRGFPILGINFNGLPAQYEGMDVAGVIKPENPEEICLAAKRLLRYKNVRQMGLGGNKIVRWLSTPMWQPIPKTHREANHYAAMLFY